MTKTNIVNAFNTGDQIVQYVWRLMQLEQKPNYGPKAVELGTTLAALPVVLTGAIDPSVNLLTIFPLEADDGRGLALWGKLPFTTSAENSIFGDGQSHSNLIRQWTELTQWYPSLTDSIGVTSNFAAATGKAQNDDIDLTPYGNKDNAGGGVASHTYLYQTTFSNVQKAFNLLTLALK